MYLFVQVIATFTLDNCWLKLRHYLCIGWGFPVVIVTMWASLIYATADKAAATIATATPVDGDVVGGVGEGAVLLANGTANAVREGGRRAKIFLSRSVNLEA